MCARLAQRIVYALEQGAVATTGKRAPADCVACRGINHPAGAIDTDQMRVIRPVCFIKGADIRGKLAKQFVRLFDEA